MPLHLARCQLLPDYETENIVPNSVARKPSAHVNVASSWLLLSYQVPRSPAAPYMNVYRRLKALRVLHVRPGLAALPEGACAEQVLQAVASHINALAGGSAVLLRSDVLNDVDHLVAAYNDERNLEYDHIVDLCTRLSATANKRGRRDDLAGRRRVARVTAQLDAVTQRDAFGASRRTSATEALRQYSAALLRKEPPR